MRGFAMAWVAAAAVVLTGSAADGTGAAPGPEPGEFHFVRMIYADNNVRGFGRGWWQQDWPRAEAHFTANLAHLTRVAVGDSETIDLLDDRLFEYPWLYATQTGYWDLSPAELARLREYLLRGGFLMCDDFWGEEWQVFADTMAELFPTRPMVPLPDDAAVLHVVYGIDEFTQIPGLRHLGRLDSLPPPRWYGIYDDSGRLMVGINYNQDVGDSWEEADTPQYPEPMTALGYRFGVNYVVYAMTH
jgi:Domain of unknown function (DUF4159)